MQTFYLLNDFQSSLVLYFVFYQTIIGHFCNPLHGLALFSEFGMAYPYRESRQFYLALRYEWDPISLGNFVVCHGQGLLCHLYASGL